MKQSFQVDFSMELTTRVSFVYRKQCSNVDFYIGLIYVALGDSVEMSLVLLAIGRTSGWTSRWLEVIDDQEPKIESPRQIYPGSPPALLRPDRPARSSAPAGLEADAGRQGTRYQQQ